MIDVYRVQDPTANAMIDPADGKSKKSTFQNDEKKLYESFRWTAQLPLNT